MADAKFAKGHKFENQDTRFVINAAIDTPQGWVYDCECWVYRERSRLEGGGMAWVKTHEHAVVREFEFDRLLVSLPPARMEYA